MKNCNNCANKGTVNCDECKTGNPPTMWVPKKKEETYVCKLGACAHYTPREAAHD